MGKKMSISKREKRKLIKASSLAVMYKGSEKNKRFFAQFYLLKYKTA
jgi:hypothetical protein